MFTSLEISCVLNVLVGLALMAALLEISRWKSCCNTNRDALETVTAERDSAIVSAEKANQQANAALRQIKVWTARVEVAHGRTERARAALADLQSRAYVRTGRAYRRWAAVA